MEALVEASIVLIAGALGGLVAAALYTIVGRRARDGAGVPAATVLRRAASYAGLAAVLLAAAWTGVPGIAVLVGAIGGIGLLEWSDLFDLPVHHRIGLLIADVAIVSVIAINHHQYVRFHLLEHGSHNVTFALSLLPPDQRACLTRNGRRRISAVVVVHVNLGSWQDPPEVGDDLPYGFLLLITGN